jgi:putative CocE/NonD family hydrolase
VRTRGAGASLVVALVLAVAAGPATAAEIETVPFEAAAADGVVLRGHAYLPKQAPRPLATVLHLSPYFEGPGHEFARTDEWSTHDEIAFLLDAGYAVAAVSMRGTGQSDGCMRFGDETDWRDAGVVVQALAAQPWSNGSVGMYGHSYVAWSQMMAAAARPPALKAIVPTSGVYDLWSLLTRRGAPLTAGLGSAFAPAFTGTTGHQPPQGVRQICPELLEFYNDNLEASKTGDRNAFFEARDLRAASTPSPVPVMTSIGIISGVNDGHILVLEDMWRRLGADRTRFVLGQWSHEVPTAHKPDWHQQVLGWFDHYLRGAPQTVRPGVVEYQDDSDAWHTSDRWPPPSSPQVLRLSGEEVVPDGEPAEPVDATFQSADNDPGLRSDQPDDKTRLYNSTCGPHQALFVSRPLAADAVLAGNAEIDLTLTSTLPGGNLSVFLWRTKGDGSCPDRSATWFGRALMDLRHWETPGRSKDFPTGEPTRVRLRSHPLAAKLSKGERIVVAIGGGSSELEPDPRHPAITVSGGSLDLPVTGAPAPALPAASDAPPLRFTPPCRSRRRFTIRLRRAFTRARVRVAGGRVRVIRRGRRLRAIVDLRGRPRGVVRVRISGVTRSGRRVAHTRRYRTCTTRRAP